MVRGDAVCRHVDKPVLDRLVSVAGDLAVVEIEALSLADETQEYASLLRDVTSKAMAQDSTPSEACDLFRAVEEFYEAALVASSVQRKPLIEGAWWRYRYALDTASGSPGLRLTGVLGVGALLVGGMFFFLSRGGGR